MPCLYIVEGATISPLLVVLLLSPSPYPDVYWGCRDDGEEEGVGVKTSNQVSSKMCLGVGSMRTREESGAWYTRTWLLVNSGTDNNTWSSNGGGGGALETER